MNRETPRYNRSREYENSINELRIEKGFTIREIADSTGGNPSMIQKLSQGMLSPTYERTSGEIKPWVGDVAALLGVSVYDMFPFEFCSINRGTHEFYGFQDPARGTDRGTPEDVFLQKELGARVRVLLSSLTPRQEAVIRLRFGFSGEAEHTQREVGDALEITGESARQIEVRALRKLRHGTRKNFITKYIEGKA